MFLLSFNWLLFLLSLSSLAKSNVGKSHSDNVHFVSYPESTPYLGEADSLTELSPNELPNGLSPSPCAQIVPGITWMSRGVDITTLALFPSDPRPDNGFKSALFDFTCTQNRTWKHPTEDQLVYALPDQIAAINTVPAGALNIKSQFNSNLKAVKESLGVSVGIDVNFIVGSFSASVDYKEARENILRSNKSVLETSATVSAMQIDFDDSDYLRPSNKFRKMLSNLPQTYESAPELYDEFVETFGTHYFASAKFGGYLYQKTVIENAYLYATSSKSIHANLEASFLSYATASADVNIHHKATDEAFQQNTEVAFSFFGGNADLSKLKNAAYLHDWQKTVLLNPWLFGGQLAPIENLIANQTVHDQVKKAVNIKLARIFLKDFKESIYLGKITLSSSDLTLVSTIEKYLNNPQIAPSDLGKMKSEIGNLFEKLTEIRDRALLAEYYHQFDNLWSGEFLEIKYNFTLKYCAERVEDKTQASFDHLKWLRSQLTDLLFSDGKPDSRSVESLVYQIAQFLPTVAETYKRVDAFCGDDSGCRSCAQSKLDYEGNWKEYRWFYMMKLNNEWTSALACKYFLANYCKSQMMPEMKAQNSNRNNLYYTFDFSGDRPHKWQMAVWVGEINQVGDKAETLLNLCSPNSPCQECLEYNANCWISNPGYDSHHCTAPDAWRVIKYTPKKIATDCKSRQL